MSIQAKKKNNVNHRIFSKRVARFANIVAMVAIFASAWYLFYVKEAKMPFYRRGNWLLITLYALLYLIIGRVYEALKISYNSVGEMVYSQALSLLEVNVIMYCIISLLNRELGSIWPALFVLFFQIVVSTIWSYLTQSWYLKTFGSDKTIVITDLREGFSNLIEDYNLTKKYNVIHTYSVEECIDDLDKLNEADVVFMAGVHSHNRNTITKHCLIHDIKAFIIPRVGDLILKGAESSHMFHLLLMKVERYNPSFEYALIKRFGDIVLSLIALILFSPIMIITVICIKLEDHGPILYKQRRLTKDGKIFELYKFRSMRVDAEKDGIARLSTGENDDRITKTGRFIRKVRIDEFPQLFNILKGDLTIVGPRPERPEIAEQYEKELPEFALRLQVKAGLTGYAQVYGKYNTIPYDKLLMDLMYISNASVFEDLKIIFYTIKILFMPESTEGVAEGSTTAMDYDNEQYLSNDGENKDSFWEN